MPAWLSYFDEAYLAAEFAHVLAGSLADQGRVDEACAIAMRAVDMAGTIRSTRIVVYLSDVARRLAPFRATADVRGLYEHMADAGISVG